MVGVRKTIYEGMASYKAYGLDLDNWEQSEAGQFWTSDKYKDRYDLKQHEIDTMKQVVNAGYKPEQQIYYEKLLAEMRAKEAKEATITQNITINSPKALSPSAIAKETKKAAQGAVLPLLR